jgi:hypothetical protein
MRARAACAAAVFVIVADSISPRLASAHVGIRDVFVDAAAGPYRTLVTIRPPHAVPGLAEIEIRTAEPDVQQVRIAPMPLSGPGVQFMPTPDVAERSPADPSRFTGRLWMMKAGGWQVRVTVVGSRGEGVLAVPVPIFPQATLEMTVGRRALLAGLMLLLCGGFIGIAAATAREATLEPGEPVGARARRRGRIAGALAALLVIAVVGLGNRWWTAAAADYSRYVYRPLESVSTVTRDGLLTLELRDPGWIALRRVDDLVPDHGHLMHLFIVSPALDRLWHLHPDETGTARFEQRLPRLPDGKYDLFADVVHASGISETATGQLDAKQIAGRPLSGDDSAYDNNGSALPDGGRIVWVRDAGPLAPKRLTMFTFRVEDAAGGPATDLEPYMGMAGHAVFVRRDRKIFAHVHPSGSAPMAALEISQRALPVAVAPPSPPEHAHDAPAVSSTLTFPFGFPEPGDYRIFVQVKRRGRIDTAAFDAHVESETIRVSGNER